MPWHNLIKNEIKTKSQLLLRFQRVSDPLVSHTQTTYARVLRLEITLQTLQWHVLVCNQRFATLWQDFQEISCPLEK